MRLPLASDKRTVIVIGHYGSGKTEFAVNYAILAGETGERVCLADLDIVNLYFRSTEKKALLAARGVRLIECTVPGNSLDLPSLSPELRGVLEDGHTKTVIDCGGDGAGARVLRQYRESIRQNGYDLFFVINAHRPQTGTKDDVLRYLREMEAESGLTVTALVNNTHLLKDTAPCDIYRGEILAREIVQASGIELRYTATPEHIAQNLEQVKNVFPLKLYFREGWMS